AGAARPPRPGCARRRPPVPGRGGPQPGPPRRSPGHRSSHQLSRRHPVMKVKMILPALTEATSPYFRPIKYALFPPLGLATLAAYLDPADEVSLQDEHVERLGLADRPDLVVSTGY